MNFDGQNIDALETQVAGAAYGDLATPGPSVTLTLIGTVAVIWMSAHAYWSGVTYTGHVSVEVSGASSVAASHVHSASRSSYAGNHTLPLARVLVLTGLTPGVNTFTLKYHNDGGGTWTFFNRSIAVYVEAAEVEPSGGGGAAQGQLGPTSPAQQSAQRAERFTEDMTHLARTPAAGAPAGRRPAY